MSAIADMEQSSLENAKSELAMSGDYTAVLNMMDTRARLIDAELAEFAESVEYFTRWVGAVVSA
ncbi:hypothetical protein PINS_up019171 [Pythium insidiosum]|nr:hypothetical protein PINS_up019171 [Pythium insidiosum]